MIARKRIKFTFFAGAGITIAGIVVRLSAESLVSTQLGPGSWSIDEAAQMQLQQDARLIIVFGLALTLLACHRWLWSIDTEADVEKN